MPQFKPSNEVYSSCQKQGYLIGQEEIDSVKIKHMISIALGDLEGIDILSSTIKKESGMWSTVYKLAYDTLHQLVEAFVRFDHIKSNNHQCLFAHLCEKHSELELDWSFLEKVRTKRNGIQYYGKPATYTDWKDIELQIKVYIHTLKEAIEAKLK